MRASLDGSAAAPRHLRTRASRRRSIKRSSTSVRAAIKCSNAQATRDAGAADAQLDQQNLNRYQTLLNSGYVSQQQVDQQRTTVRNDQQQVLSAQASLQSAVLNAHVNGNYQQGLQAANVASAQADAASAHAQAEQIQAQIDKALITSPVDGVVVNRNLNPGEYPGSRTIFTVQQLDPVYAELNASSSKTCFRIQRGAPSRSPSPASTRAPYRGRSQRGARSSAARLDELYG